MNQKIPYLTRQVVYAFLVGLIIGGVTMALFDAYAKKPLFGSANFSAEYDYEDVNNECISWYQDTMNCWRNSFGGGFGSSDFNWYGGGGTTSGSTQSTTSVTPKTDVTCDPYGAQQNCWLNTYDSSGRRLKSTAIEVVTPNDPAGEQNPGEGQAGEDDR